MNYDLWHVLLALVYFQSSR